MNTQELKNEELEQESQTLEEEVSEKEKKPDGGSYGL